MQKAFELYQLWREKAVNDIDLKEELNTIKGDEKEIYERFWKNLEFGTGGLRGIIGAGTNRMNVYTVSQTTQGLADYLNINFESPSVAIAYDSRIKSNIFAKEAACVLAANNVSVYIYEELMPTPMLSFAVRELNCSSGIVITASHNPSQYNGYKCYDSNGYQMTDEVAKTTYNYIQKVDIFNDVKRIDFEKAFASGKIKYIDSSIINKYYELVLRQQIEPSAYENSDLKIIFTPLNGSSNKHVRAIFNKIGVKNLKVVTSQEKPDGNFPTCPYPNPEVEEAFSEAIKMTDNFNADLIIATDPDGDRVGISVLDRGEYRHMSGNDVGCMLTEYILSRKLEKEILPENPIVIKTIVTTELLKAITESYGGEIVDLLTGFKYIGEYVTKLEEKNESSRFIIGMEESYGYLTGTYVREKDAILASMLVVEMAAYYKKKGMSLISFLDSLYAKYGAYYNSLMNFAFEGVDGMKEMSKIMDNLRSNIPSSIADLKVLSVSDYQNSTCLDLNSKEISIIDLPESNVISFLLSDSNKLIIRPSGTEPKIKIYISAHADSMTQAKLISQKLSEEIKKITGIK